LFFDRPESGELAVLVHLELDCENEPEDPREFEELVLSAGGDPVEFVTGRRSTPHPRYFVGSGKLEELQQRIKATGAELLIFNHNLSPSQERNLEKTLQCRILDRTGLILDIFAQRARTHEGKLQVELAQLEHMSTRLVRGWTHLERQKGGIGLRGPGETQLETDRRLLRARIKSIHKRLEKVRRQRQQGRRSRKRAEVPTISLVGYTNAGKSTLFNVLTEAGVYAADQLFATLDPTMRRLNLSEIGPVVLADTVGFISHLPHKLVEAFRATLEEAASASLLLHIIDVHAEDRHRNIERVNQVLEEIDAEGRPRLLVYNKIDLLENVPPSIERDANGQPKAVWLSAQQPLGLDLLKQAIRERLASGMVRGTLHLQLEQSRLRARLYDCQAILDETILDDGSSRVRIGMRQSDFERLLQAEGVAIEQLELEETLPVTLPVKGAGQDIVQSA